MALADAVVRCGDGRDQKQVNGDVSSRLAPYLALLSISETKLEISD
jgi:hypothetical protein